MLALDAVARRYGKLPHEVEQLTPYQLGLAFLCIERRRESAERHVKDAMGVVVVDCG